MFRGHGAVFIAIMFMGIYGASAFVLVQAGGSRMQARIRGGDMVERGRPMEMELTVINRGKLPVFCCTCEVIARNLLTGEDVRLPVMMGLPPGGSRTERFALEDQYCGKIRCSLEQLRISDSMRVFRRAKAVDPAAEAAGFIMPRLEPVPIPADFLDSYNMESYQYSQYEKGSDPGEVFGVRDYQEGDSLKQIHWKLSAKLGSMTVKIPSYPIENNILVLLDNLLEPGDSLTPDEKSKLAERFCSLSASLLEKNIPHSAAWYDTNDQTIHLRRIRSMEELWREIPEILGCGFERDEVSVVYRYLESKGGQGFTNHFLVTAREGRDADWLEEHGAVRIFRTTE